MITSTANERVKYARSLRRRRQRGREGHFLVEGIRLLEEAVGAGYTPALLFFQPEQLKTPRERALLALMEDRRVPCLAASEEVLHSLSQTVTPQGIVAVLPRPQLPASPAPDLVLVLDRLRDPGNMGAILRSAAAAGVDEVLLGPGSVDPYNDKVVRAGAGAHFRLPLSYGLAWPKIAAKLGGITLWLADSQAGQSYDSIDWCQPSALIIGGEAAGAGEQAIAQAHAKVHIPMCDGTESLNAAASTAIILFEAARQRRLQAPAD